ncbi:MAG: acetate/propionate family kinase [Vicinamibacterales bacterium]
MERGRPCVLALNAGSSSIKFAVYASGSWTAPVLRGKLDQRGSLEGALSWITAAGQPGRTDVRVTHDSLASHLIDWLVGRSELSGVEGVGHRIVHGMSRSEPARVTPELLQELRGTIPYAPDHLPLEIALVESVERRHPGMPQVTAFDTAFHHDLIPAARLLPIPRRYVGKGVRRYGFHGLSYAFLLEELQRLDGKEAALGRVILAHLGNGASMAAVRGGRGIDTSMGLTPAAGLTMSTRTGDLDPGLVSFLARTEQMTVAEFDRLVNHESGLLGVSETSSDMRELLARETSDARAAEAVALFCYQAKKWVGAFAAVLGGLDTLVFSAGIGEHSAPVRARISEGLGFLGVELDEARNAVHAPIISTDTARVRVRVIPTNEELMIARSTARALNMDATDQES